jgi:hypothetical protein
MTLTVDDSELALELVFKALEKEDELRIAGIVAGN